MRILPLVKIMEFAHLEDIHHHKTQNIFYLIAKHSGLDILRP